MHSTPNIKQLLEGKKLLIFDFDGTIADTSSLHASAFQHVLSPLNISVDYSEIAGLKTLDAIVHCARCCGLVLSKDELADLAISKQRLVRAMIGSQLKPLDNVGDFLDWASKHFQISMATSGSRDTVSLALEKLGYTSFFNPLVCAEDVARAKPHPDLFVKVLEITRFIAGEALVFEDSEAGFKSARSAGLQYIDVRDFNWHYN